MPTDLPPTLRRYADHMRKLGDLDGLRGITVPTNPTEISDGGGHVRPAYPGLFTFVLHRLGLDVDALAEQLHETADWPIAPPTGAEAETLTRTAWNTLASAAVSNDAAQAAALFERVAEQHARFSDDGSNPEPRWYAELVLLHAWTSYAAWAHRPDLLTAAADAAAYHQAETQPDHATGQPWAINAALLRPETLPLADLLLLPTSMPDGQSLVNRLLLADAVTTLESSAFAEASTW